MPKKGSLAKSRGGDKIPEREAATFTNKPAIVDESKQRKRPRKNDHDAEDDDLDLFVNPQTSARILKTARQQKEKMDMYGDDSDRVDSDDEERATNAANKRKRLSKLSLSDVPSTRLGDEDDDGDLSDEGSEFEAPVVHIDAHESALLSAFMTPNVQQRRTLGELIQAKIDEKKTEIESVMSDAGGDTMHLRNLDPRLIELYRGVRDLLSKYRSGALPKAFKLIPKLVNWEQMIAITEPEKWSAASVYAATRMFAANSNKLMCQRFYNLILLPRVRDDILEYKKLNFHLYQAVRKALFKPAAFFKGFLLPLCETGECTHREAVIMCSVLAKCSIPMLHTAAVIVRIAGMEYNGANSIFLRTLIDKKYTLPFQTVDAVVAHFVKFMKDEREMPVLWHQCLLALCQRYKDDLTPTQIKQLLKLTKTHHHHMITEEIRRELGHAVVKNNEKKAKLTESMDVE